MESGYGLPGGCGRTIRKRSMGHASEALGAEISAGAIGLSPAFRPVCRRARRRGREFMTRGGCVRSVKSFAT